MPAKIIGYINPDVLTPEVKHFTHLAIVAESEKEGFFAYANGQITPMNRSLFDRIKQTDQRIIPEKNERFFQPGTVAVLFSSGEIFNGINGEVLSRLKEELEKPFLSFEDHAAIKELANHL